MKQCGATITFRGQGFQCEKKANHTGNHTAGSICTGVDYSFSWLGDLDVPWPEPKTSLSVMGWRNYKARRLGQADFCGAPETKAYRAAWEKALDAVRGKLAQAPCVTHFCPGGSHITIVAFDEILDECK